MARLPPQKSKIVCTIGPASDKSAILEAMLRSGMDVARINLAHGSIPEHAQRIQRIRAAAERVGKRVAILADLPGPKIRIGTLPQAIQLKKGERLRLGPGAYREEQDQRYLPLELPNLARPLRKGDDVFLADGFLHLRVDAEKAGVLQCRVLIGGELRSHKGVNLPGLLLAGSALTEHDQELLRAILPLGVDGLSVSFVETASDLEHARSLAAEQGYAPFLVAKIERQRAVRNLPKILAACDAIMVARGDLGVETPIPSIARQQKQIIHQARAAGKAVITATQMLESMVQNARPTRAEVTDVANAILDGSDAVMLSEESAMGQYPVESVRMMARIAADIEGSEFTARDLACPKVQKMPVEAVIACDVRSATAMLQPVFIVTPTETGATAARIARLRPAAWILAPSRHADTCQRLCFYSGVHPLLLDPGSRSWETAIRDWLRENSWQKGHIILTQGPSQGHPGGTNRLEVIDLAVPEVPFYSHGDSNGKPD
ncbi:pyruvate kinase [Acidithiobacillus sp. IBUN Pt1247-S3]|uniref:pyruvate kinase n=1 Tax=Acidithiobacillus sp. IBUN Pt1247-S3 TaxID=3166642 RepID=UPI0034E44F01